MALKKHLVKLGIPKDTVDQANGKSGLLQLHTQFSAKVGSKPQPPPRSPSKEAEVARRRPSSPNPTRSPSHARLRSPSPPPTLTRTPSKEAELARSALRAKAAEDARQASSLQARQEEEKARQAKLLAAANARQEEMERDIARQIEKERREREAKAKEAQEMRAKEEAKAKEAKKKQGLYLAGEAAQRTPERSKTPTRRFRCANQPSSAEKESPASSSRSKTPRRRRAKKMKFETNELHKWLQQEVEEYDFPFEITNITKSLKQWRGAPS